MIDPIYLIVPGSVLAGFLFGALFGMKEGRESTLIEMDAHRAVVADAIREAMKTIDQARASVPLPHRITTAQQWLAVALNATYDMQRPISKSIDVRIETENGGHIHPFTFGESHKDTSKGKA